MRLQKIALLVILVVGMFTFSQSASSQSSSGVGIVSIRSYTDDYDYYHLVGEIVNEKSEAIQNVGISVTFYDSSKKVLTTDYTYAMIEVLYPNQRSPFSITLFDDDLIRNIGTYKLDITYDVPAVDKQPMLQLELGNSYMDDYGIYHISGEVTNYGDSTARYVEVASAFYGSKEQILYVDNIYTRPPDIAPGMKASFELTLWEDEVGLIKQASVNVQSYEYSMMTEPYTPEPAGSTITLNLETDTIKWGDEIKVSGEVKGVQERDRIILIEIFAADSTKVYSKFTAPLIDEEEDGVGWYKGSEKFYGKEGTSGQIYTVEASYNNVVATSQFTYIKPAEEAEKAQAQSEEKPEITGIGAVKSSISLRDLSGKVASSVGVGAEVRFAATITNNNAKVQPYVYIIQVKDSEGATVHISWHGGALGASETTSITPSWTPTDADRYTIEIFVWQDLDNPAPLSAVTKDILMVA